VSMNCWGFQPDVFGVLAAGFAEFLRTAGQSPTAECYLPDVLQRAISAGRARVRVLAGGATWLGITHPQDRARVVARIAEYTRAGEYPAALWSET
jgi:hypothetical protein